MPKWRRRLATNQFYFSQLCTDSGIIGIGVGTIRFATLAFCYHYDPVLASYSIVEGIRPLTLGCTFGDHLYQGQSLFRSNNLEITIDLEATEYQLSVSAPGVDIEAQCHRDLAPLAVCSPAGRHGWVFTQKEMTSRAQANIDWHRDSHELDVTSAVPVRASLDWTVGYMRRVTNWYWASINTVLADGCQFGLNLANGVNETGTSENVCWIGTEQFYLPPVLFERQRHDRQMPWRIYHQQLGWSTVELDLEFVPIDCYQKWNRAGIFDSIFEQWVGHYRGSITINGRTIIVNDVLGIAEDHYARW